MALTGIIIETPAFTTVGLPIVVSAYDIQREINAAGSFSVAFPASQALARQVRSRWRVSIVEEGRTDYLLRRGIVTNRTYRVSEDGTGILTLAGYTRLYALTAESTHIGLSYDGTQTIVDIANDLTGVSVTVPASASSRSPVVTYSDTSKLAALLTACELARYNLRETFDEDGFELVEQDDVPDSGFRFVNVEQAGPELQSAAENGMGLIAGTPTIGYDGGDLATRIIPIGADWDGKPLTLGSSNKSAPYAIQSASNPDGSQYYYLEDATALASSGVIELQYVRSDVKNPSDNAGTRQAAANVLYALAAGELLKRRSDVISFACEIANGRHIDALPGDRVRIQFRGVARTITGGLTWQDIDQDFLIAKRRDAAGESGIRGVSFTLTAPEVVLTIPSLPDAVPIPPPPSDPPDPPRPKDNSKDPDDGEPPEDLPPFEDPGLPPDPGMPDLANPIGTPGAYQPCCADPTTDINDGAEDPPDTDPEDPEEPGETGMVALPWVLGNAIPEGSALFLLVADMDIGSTPSYDGFTLTPTNMTATLLHDFETIVEHISNPNNNLNVRNVYYKVVATGASPGLSFSSPHGNSLVRGYIFYPTTTGTCDVVSSSTVSEPFTPGDTFSVSLALGAGQMAAYVGAGDVDANGAFGTIFNHTTHHPSDDGWIENSSPQFGRKAGGGTMNWTFADPGNILIAQTSISFGGCIAELTP